MRALTPEIVKFPKTKVLTIKTVGAPNQAANAAIPALYGTAYGTKFKVFKPKKQDMAIGRLSCFWPNAHQAPKSKWIGQWMLEVPFFVGAKDLLQKDPKHKISVFVRPAGTAAQILHLGSYSKEGPTVKILHAFVKAKGYQLAGPHEEIYLTKPDAKVVKTIIRYIVKKK